MKTVRTKIGSLVLLCVIVSAVLIGFVSIRSSRTVVEENSEQIMDLLCTNKTEEIDALMSRIEQSVITLSEYALDHIDDLEKFKTDSAYVSSYSSKMEEIAVNAANNTEGAMTVYIRFNPEFTEPTSGVFYTRETADSEFVGLTPTDFSMYDKTDTARVGWYYIPVNNGKPTWLDPYLNENIDVQMISYVIPLFIDGTEVGIVGMDIDFGVIEEIVDNTSVYSSGHAFLANAAGQAIVHKDFEMYESMAESSGGELSAMAEQLQQENSEGLFSYRLKGVSQNMVFHTLRNGMRFVLTAPTSEINREADRLIMIIAVIVIGAVLLSVVISWIVARGIVRPLNELNTAAGKIAEGELDVTISSTSRDEVGTLADSFRKTVQRLQTYIIYIDEIAAVLAQMGEGNLAISLQQEYAGEFRKLKEGLQTIAGTLSGDIYRIKIAAEQVSSGAVQVSEGAQVLSQGATEQSVSIEELSKVMIDMLQYANENERLAAEASEMTSAAGVGLEANSRQMQTMVKAMEDISTNADAITAIIKTINEIAMQTNILSLNASIEAARAGEAGKGFTIVAEEVKNLAGKSMEAATEIEELVAGTVESINKGAKIAVDTEQSITTTVTKAQQVAGMVDSIKVTSEKQAAGAEQVQQRVEKISAVVEQNSATSQEEAAASEELSAQAQMLETLVGKFILQEHAGDKTE